MAATSEHAGVLVIRAWVEADERSLRARITGRVDVTATHETSVVVAGLERATEVVRRWFEEFEREARIEAGAGLAPKAHEGEGAR
jgi:hypothetical protein